MKTAGIAVLVGAACAAALPNAGCAKIGTRIASTEQVVLAHRTEEVPDETAVSVAAQLSGHSRLKLDAVHLCRVRSVRDTERIEHIESYNETPARTWTAAGIGLAAAGSGVIVLGDSANVHPSDESSRTFNPVGPGGAQAIGGSLLAVGAIAGAIAVVDVVSAGEAEDRREPFEVRDDPEGSASPCASHPAAGVKLHLFAGDAYPLGTTNGVGHLQTDLDNVLPGDLVWEAHEVSIVHGDQNVGDVNLGAFVAWRESRDWQSLPRSACKKPTASDSCLPVEQFSRRYPRGEHLAEARRLLLEAKPELERLADEEAWSRTQAEKCKARTFASPEEGETACASLKGYVEKFPQGAHAEEARFTLEAADTRIAALVESRAAEAERERLREERERQRLQREAEAAEKRQQSEVRNRCVATCRHKCMAGRFWNKSLCQKGCVNAECDGNVCVGYCQADCAVGSKANIPECSSTCIAGRCGGQ